MSYYTKNVKLKHDEVPAAINPETGEFRVINERPNNLKDKNKEIVAPDKFFAKLYSKSWDYLLDNLSENEITIVARMIKMTRMNSNSLEPLNNETNMSELSRNLILTEGRLRVLLINC